MSKVGIVSYYAPPNQAIASQRILRLSRVLVSAGHEVHWITLDPASLGQTDTSLEAFIPSGIKVHGLGGIDRVQRPVKTTFDRVEHTLVHALRGTFGLPDRYFDWTLRLMRKLPGLVKRQGLNALIVSCGPHGQILAVPLVRALARELKIVVDYRDLLSANPWNLPKYPHARALLLQQERWCLRAADLLLINSQQALEAHQKVVGAIKGLEVMVLRNAADYALAEELRRNAPAPELGPGAHFGFFGALYERRRLAPFLAGMAQLSEEQLAKITLHTYCPSAGQPLLEEDLKAAGPLVAARVVQHAHVSYVEAVRVMQAMHGLVMVNGPDQQDQVFVPGKLYDYLMARRPVFMIGGRGDAWDIISGAGQPELCFTYSDVAALGAAIQRLASEPPKEMPEAKQYSVEETFAPLLARL